jgi:chemotaxis methyl-accepting protein methylase
MGVASRSASREEEPAPPPFVAQVQDTLRRRERFELAGYRAAYVQRRLAARLAATGDAPEAYARRLESDADERRLLVEALGINVTAFFRDPGVWLFLEEVALPPLVDERVAAGGQVRALSLGCAGGQEAYSLAMLLAELLDGDLDRFRVEAWDMDGAALEVAREAWYPRAALENLSASAVARYFEAEGEGYRVSKALRARVKVGRRDMLTEDISGGFDVVLLRNVTIYFGREAKERLFRRVRGSLAPRGLLVLGQSETMLGEAGELFRPLSLRNRVYARVDA